MLAKTLLSDRAVGVVLMTGSTAITQFTHRVLRVRSLVMLTGIVIIGMTGRTLRLIG